MCVFLSCHRFPPNEKLCTGRFVALNQDGKEDLRRQYETKKVKEMLSANMAHIEKKSRGRQLTRYMNKQRQQFEHDQQMQKAEEESAFKEWRIDQENNLAMEMDNLKRKEMKEQLLRQRLRENDPELKELERKLKAAYINKELAAQISQKEAQRRNEKIHDQKVYEILQTALLKEEDLKMQQAKETIIKKAIYKKELQDQIILREKSKRYLYEEFLREKKMIDDIIQRIHDEDEREIAEKMCKMKKTKEEMVAFEAAQALWKKRKKDEIEEENRKIQEFLLAKGTEIQARLDSQKKKANDRFQIQENIARQMYADNMKKKEREDILQDLLEEEQKAKVDQRYREDMEKQVRQRLETMAYLTSQMADKEERMRQEAEIDARYQEQLLKKLAEDEKVEQMSAQKKRMKMLQLRRDVEQMMIERRQKKAEEMQLLIKLKEQEDKELEERKRVVEEERTRMLKDHVKNLIGYLPKGLLRPEDLPHLGTDILK